MATTSPLLRIPLPQTSDTDQVPSDLLTQTAAAETYFIGRFASSAERGTYLTAAGLGSGVRGMLSWVDAPGRYERHNGTTWVPLIESSLLTATGALKGAAWDGVSPRIEQKFSAVTSTNSAGGFAAGFLSPFPNGLLSCQIVPGDTSGPLGLIVPIAANHSLAACQGIAYSPTGVALNTAGIRLEIDATGW